MSSGIYTDSTGSYAIYNESSVETKSSEVRLGLRAKLDTKALKPEKCFFGGGLSYVMFDYGEEFTLGYPSYVEYSDDSDSLGFYTWLM